MPISRGQVAAVDALVAFTVFALIFSLYVSFRTQLESSGPSALELAAPDSARVAYELSEWPGDPVNWNQTTFRQVGLAQSRGVIDDGKLTAFLNSNPATLQNALGISAYQFRFRLLNATTGTVATTSGGLSARLGSDPSGNVSFVSPYSMPVVYNGTAHLLEVTLWN